MESPIVTVSPSTPTDTPTTVQPLTSTQPSIDPMPKDTILVATLITQGSSPLDFNWCDENEILMFGFECTSGTWDDHCGCRRSLVGIKTHKGTTTFMVQKSPHTVKGLLRLLSNSLIDAGWYTSGSPEATRHARTILYRIREIANQFPSGTILERRDNHFIVRQKAADTY
jgi:hypothetical protein